MKSCPMRWGSVSEANVRSTQLSSGVGDAVGEAIGVGLGVMVGVGVGEGVGSTVGLLVGDGDGLGVGDAAAGANRHPDSSAATRGSTTIGLIGRSRRRGVTTPSTPEVAKTCMGDGTLGFLRPWLVV
jgi:hypothetical protein